MMNEFGRLTLECTADSLIPNPQFGTQYTDINNQVCTLPGGTPGTTDVSGSDYIRLAFDYDPSHLWRNFGITIVLIVGFLIANSTFGEYFNFGAGGKTVTFFAKENAETKRLNEELAKRKSMRQQKKKRRPRT